MEGCVMGVYGGVTGHRTDQEHILGVCLSALEEHDI